MYSVAEIANLCGVSTVAVYKKIKKLNNIEKFIVKEHNKTMIMEEGYELIKGSLQVNKQIITSEIAVSSDENEKSDDIKQELNELISFLKVVLV